MAALAGCCRDVGSAGLDEQERAIWRGRARRWLRADLGVLRKALEIDPATGRDLVRTTLSHWREEPDLAGLREPTELAKQSLDERNDCLTLWDEVNVMGERAGRGK